jgi:hypothetical protein
MTKSKKKFAKFLVLSVGGLGLVSATLLLSDPPSPSELDPSLFNLNYQKHTSGRSLASAGVRSSPDAMFEINCRDTDQKLETSSMRFRLKGQACTNESTALSTQIQNKSNGYIATVFHRDPQSFTTDYINLNEGQNEIAVKFATENGLIERKIMITRNPSSVRKSN